MKKAILILAALTVAAAVVLGAVKLFGGNSTVKAGAVADSFLTSFFEMDYESAAGFCSEEIGSLLLASVSSREYPSESIGEKVSEASKGTAFKVNSCEKTEEKNTVEVKYTVTPFGGGAGIEHTMTLVKRDGEWKISRLD